MAENGGVACKCSTTSASCYYRTINSSLEHRTRSIHRKFFFRNVSMRGRFITRWRSIAANKAIFSMDAREKSRSTTLQSSKHRRVPVFVMMPVDTFGIDASGTPRIRRIRALTVSLKALKLAGVHGIAVEVWWGIVERFSPFEYNWSLYEELLKLISDLGLKIHIALCFHSNTHLYGGKGGISLPLWIQEIGNLNKDVYYQDKNGFSNDDYLTLGVDQLPLFHGRTALQCYEDFICSFTNNFESLMGSVIEEINVGLGPSGELRYPAHPSGDGRWKFPGIGEFQCYDKYMMEDLKNTACQEGKPQWGERGPQNAGCYNSLPSGVPFFEEGQDSFLSDYGRFFLEWYSGKLICHADAIISKAANILRKYSTDENNYVILVAKIGGIYWWYQTASHPAELTAGYYNTALRDGYDPVALMLSRHGAALHISCWDMMDSETSPTYLCSPEGLLQQIWAVSKKRIVNLIGRNANEQLDKMDNGFLQKVLYLLIHFSMDITGLRQIHKNCYHPHAEAVRSFTYFRMNEKIFRVENWNNFVPFVRQMSADL